MQSQPQNERNAFVSAKPAGRREVRFAIAAVLVSVAIFCAAAPFATMQFARVPAFIPAYQAALVIKIDQGFVTGCAANPSARAIVESSVEMARRLNLKSVAEGVETQADWDVLRATSCDLAQGYFIAKPMQESAFLAFCTAKASS